MRRPCQLRLAKADEAESIYNLKLNAFGQRYLSYTIYQSALSVKYIRELISLGHYGSKNKIIVAVLDGRIGGYYEALRCESDLFLNYIAVDKNIRQSGLGSALLNDFEECGCTLGCTRLALDVFESNSGAREWYERRGYASVSSCFLVQVPISGLLSDVRSTREWLPKWPADAFDEERSRGFSKAEYVCDSYRITVGLIDGRMCKLLAYDGLTQDGALHIIAGLCPNRGHIIVPNLHEIPTMWPISAAERSIQLVKPVRQNNE